MIHLLSTNEFKVNGFAYPGFPLLTWSNTNEALDTVAGHLFEEGHEFLMYWCLKRGKVESPDSAVTYAKHLISFFTFCEDNEQDWRDIEDDGVNEMLVAVYRDNCGLEGTTLNQHLGTIIRFYRFAVSRGWIDSLPYSLETVRTSKNKHDFLAHTKTDGGEVLSEDIKIKNKKKLPKFLSKSEVETLLKAIKNPVIKLMVRLALQVGLRKKEIIFFPLNAVRKPLPNEKICKVTINRTKGEKERVIHIPSRLMKDLWHYSQTLRHQQEQSSSIKSERLFLRTSDNKEFNYKSNGFGKALKDLKLSFKVTPHMLRHTYACHMLKGLQERKRGKFEPLMYLQRRLGHSSITTTMIYLEIVNDLMDDLSLEYQDSINNIVDVESAA